MTHMYEHGKAPRYGTATRREINGPTGHLARLEPFSGSSMRALWASGGRYLVYSYDTLIAEENSGTLWFTEEYYSPKTTEHVNCCRAWLGRQDYWHATPPSTEED